MKDIHMLGKRERAMEIEYSYQTDLIKISNRNATIKHNYIFIFILFLSIHKTFFEDTRTQ